MLRTTALAALALLLALLALQLPAAASGGYTSKDAVVIGSGDRVPPAECFSPEGLGADLPAVAVGGAACFAVNAPDLTLRAYRATGAALTANYALLDGATVLRSGSFCGESSLLWRAGADRVHVSIADAPDAACETIDLPESTGAGRLVVAIVSFVRYD